MFSKSKIFLSVILSTKNDSRHILMTIFDIHRYLEQQPYTSEIIVVDDCSYDSTNEMIHRCQSLIPNLKLINNKISKGGDFTVKQAMLLAKGDWRLLLSPKNKVSVIEFNKIIPYARANYQIFKKDGGGFSCYSAEATENIFSGQKKEKSYSCFVF